MACCRKRLALRPSERDSQDGLRLTACTDRGGLKPALRMTQAPSAYADFSLPSDQHPLGWTLAMGGLNARGTDARCGGSRRCLAARRGGRAVAAILAAAGMERATGAYRPVGQHALAAPASAGAGAA